MSDLTFTSFKKRLKTNGHFATAPRMKLFVVLLNHPNLTIKELIERTSKHDQATAYRNITLFEKLGIITVTKYGWVTRIELTDDFHPHHHHISCTICGTITSLPHSDELENSIDLITKQSDYISQTHKLEVRGICPTCQKANKIDC